MADIGGNFVNPQSATPEQRAQLYAYANALMKPQPVNNWAQGLAEMARSLVGGYESNQADQQGQQAIQNQQQLEAPLYGAAGNLGGGGANPASQVGSQSSAAPDEQEAYIRAAAAQRGIDPDTAVKVARSEGLGASSYAGDSNSSFGPFQLHYGGVAPGGNSSPGLGDAFTKATGLDARDPSTWKQQTDFALDNAAQGGWGPWHGAAAVGIAPTQGITGQPAPTRLAGPVPTPDTGSAPPAAPPPQQMAQGGPAPLQGGPGAPSGGHGISPQQVAAIMASPYTSPETRAMVAKLYGPQVLTDPYGGNHPYVPIQGAAAPSATPQVHFGGGSAGGVNYETATTPSGPGGAPTTGLLVPGAGAPGTQTSSNGIPTAGPLSGLAPLVSQGQGFAAQGANVAAKQGAATQRYQAAQEAGPQLMQASYPLRQLQQIITANGGQLPSGEGSEPLMKGLSIANMLGTLMGHPVAKEDSTLPSLELLKKYGMQAAQAQSQQLGLHTNLGLESAEITSPNPQLSGVANAHLVDNLVRLNQLAQKKAAFEHDLFLKGGQGPDSYDDATNAWQEATSGANAVPLASERFGQKFSRNGQQLVKVPSTDPSGFSVYPAGDPALQ